MKSRKILRRGNFLIMRHKFRKPCVNPDKAHLWRLPDMEYAPPRVESPSKRAIVLIPLFESKPWHDGIVHHNGIGAIWARQSWLRFTDALDLGIEIKFYVEQKMLSEAAQIFRDNYVDDRDILIFDGTPFDERAWLCDNLGSFTGEAKKCSMFTNPDLADYEWVFMVDSDVFVVSSKENNLYFFRQFFDTMPRDGLVSLVTTSNEYWHDNPPHQTAITDGWCRTASHTRSDAGNEAFESKCADFFGDEMVDVHHCIVHPKSVRTWHDDRVKLTDLYFKTDYWYLNCQNGLMAFPAKEFMSNRWEDCQWLTDASHILLSDEFVFSVWHSRGKHLYEMRHHTDIESVMLTIFSGSGADIERYRSFIHDGTPFLFHYGSPLIEKTWREGIGAL